MAIALSLPACGNGTNTGLPNSPASASGALGVLRAGAEKAPQKTATAVLQQAELWREVPATVRSLDHISVSAEVDGRVLGVHAEVGDRVTKGQKLATLEASVQRSQKDGAQAALELAESELQRVRRLVEAKVASQREQDAAESTYKRALAALEVAETALSRSEVLSPVDGVVEARLNGPGDLAYPGKPLFSLYDPNHLVLDVQIPIEDRNAVGLGKVLSWEIGDQKSESKIIEIAPSSDPRSRTLRVRLEMATQGKEFLRTLAPGTYGVLRYSVGQRPFIAIPSAAIRQVGQVQMIVVLDEQKTWRRRAVKTGSLKGDQIEILSGLAGGETVGWND